MLRKLVGVFFLLIGIAGIAVSVAGVYLGRQAIDEFGAAVDIALSRSLVTLDTAADTLILTKSTFDRVNSGLDTVGVTADNVAQTLIDTQPMLENISSVVATDIPDSLEAIQNSLPGVAEAAGTIDDTLRALAAFEVSREVFGIPIAFDLGIDYEPELSLDEGVLSIGDSIEGMPDSLRAMQPSLDLANNNLADISTNINDIATDLDAIGDNVKQIEPLIDEYIMLIADVEQLMNQTQAKLDSQLDMAKIILTLLFVWLGVNQVVPIYLSIDILTQKSEDDEDADETRDNSSSKKGESDIYEANQDEGDSPQEEGEKDEEDEEE
jgi:hypothetical protein